MIRADVPPPCVMARSSAGERIQSFATAAMALAGVALITGLLAWGGVWLTRSEGRIAVVWLPNAVLIAVMFRSRVTAIPAILASGLSANIVANMISGDGFITATAMSVANGIEILVVWLGMSRLGRSRPDMSLTSDLSIYCLLAGLIAPACSAALITGMIGPGSFDGNLALFGSWMAADGLGMILLTPTVLILFDAWCGRGPITRRDVLDWTGLSVVGTSLTIGVFAQHRYPFLFLVMPVVLIYAFRRGSVGTAVSIIKITVIASFATAYHSGPIPLTIGSLGDRLVVLQLFLATCFAMGLPLAVVLKTRAELSDKLRMSQRSAEQAAQAKSAFLANMSHEIRTPMNGVIGFTEMLLASDVAAEQRRQLELIAESGRTMMQLLNDILDISKIEAGQMQITEEPIDLRHKIDTAVRLLRPIAEEKGVDIRISIASGVPDFIVGDSLRLRQIILNLVGNAVKFTSNGYVAVTVNVDRDGPKPQFCLQVRDSGIGIPADRLAHVFDPFVQADGSTARHYGGSGLGLAISAQLARAMGGTISVVSEVEQGSTFQLVLPMVEAKAGSRKAGTSEATTKAAPADSDRPRVLVAEDHDINRVLMLAMAERAGFLADLAHDGHEAIAKVAAADASGYPYRLVLMDVQMPGLDGIEATRRLRAAGYDGRRLPIVALTANAYAEDVAACLAAGMQGHLAKPVALADLRRILATYLDNRPGIGDASLAAPGPAIETPPAPIALIARYRRRRDETIACLKRFSPSHPPSDSDIEELVELLHKLAGTAAYFGEEEIGAAAASLEHELAKTAASDVFATITRHAKIVELAA